MTLSSNIHKGHDGEGAPAIEKVAAVVNKAVYLLLPLRM